MISSLASKVLVSEVGLSAVRLTQLDERYDNWPSM